MGMKKPLLLQCEKKYLATAMVLFEYCAAFGMSIYEKIFRVSYSKIYDNLGID